MHYVPRDEFNPSRADCSRHPVEEDGEDTREERDGIRTKKPGISLMGIRRDTLSFRGPMRSGNATEREREDARVRVS
jgi:hypothetical protein